MGHSRVRPRAWYWSRSLSVARVGAGAGARTVFAAGERFGAVAIRRRVAGAAVERMHGSLRGPVARIWSVPRPHRVTGAPAVPRTGAGARLAVVAGPWTVARTRWVPVSRLGPGTVGGWRSVTLRSSTPWRRGIARGWRVAAGRWAMAKRWSLAGRGTATVARWCTRTGRSRVAGWRSIPRRGTVTGRGTVARHRAVAGRGTVPGRGTVAVVVSGVAVARRCGGAAGAVRWGDQGARRVDGTGGKHRFGAAVGDGIHRTRIRLPRADGLSRTLPGAPRNMLTPGGPVVARRGPARGARVTVSLVPRRGLLALRSGPEGSRGGRSPTLSPWCGRFRIRLPGPRRTIWLAPMRRRGVRRSAARPTRTVSTGRHHAR